MARGIGHSSLGLSRAGRRVLKRSRVLSVWLLHHELPGIIPCAREPHVIPLSVKREILIKKRRQVSRIHILKTFDIYPFTYKYLYCSFP